MRFRLLIAVLAVVAAACGGTGDSATNPAPTEAPNATAAPTTGAPGSTTPGNGDGTAAPTTEAPDSQRPATEGPAAPAINTILSDGTEFSLADEANPVYLVFWAEW
ncbi:MAG: hypothetical protein HKN91_06470 [Acidimicrobiia bacterium]|nr:hypothetical protein [Acidimicrobiia bacterium]